MVVGCMRERGAPRRAHGIEPFSSASTRKGQDAPRVVRAAMHRGVTELAAARVSWSRRRAHIVATRLVTGESRFVPAQIPLPGPEGIVPTVAPT